MASKIIAMFFIVLHFMLLALPPIYACGPCTQPHPPLHRRPSHPKPHPKPPHHGGGGGGGEGGGGGGSSGGGGGGHHKPPSKSPPKTKPPIISPYPPYTPPQGSSGGRGGGGGGGDVPGIRPPPSISPPPATCPIDALKLGLCLDVLGGLVHVGLGNPVENVCCPVLQGLLELEAAICLCTVIRLKLLNLNIFIPLALQVLVTCGLTPPLGFVCPPLN